MSFIYKTEEYYKKFIELQEKLRKSEEERLKLEMKFNEMVKVTREEKQMHYRKLRSQYKRFLEEDGRRQDRNDRILRTLERIENRIAMIMAKTDRCKLLRQQYQSLLSRMYQSQVKNPEILTATEGQHKLQPVEKTSDKSDIVETYLQNLSSQKLREYLKTQDDCERKVPSAAYSEDNYKNYERLYSYNDSETKPNYVNSIADDIMNSIYCRNEEKMTKPELNNKREYPGILKEIPKVDRTAEFGPYPNILQTEKKILTSDVKTSEESEVDDLSELKLSDNKNVYDLGLLNRQILAQNSQDVQLGLNVDVNLVENRSDQISNMNSSKDHKPPINDLDFAPKKAEKIDLVTVHNDQVNESINESAEPQFLSDTDWRSLLLKKDDISQKNGNVESSSAVKPQEYAAKANEMRNERTIRRDNSYQQNEEEIERPLVQNDTLDKLQQEEQSCVKEISFDKFNGEKVPSSSDTQKIFKETEIIDDHLKVKELPSRIKDNNLPQIDEDKNHKSKTSKESDNSNQHFVNTEQLQPELSYNRTDHDLHHVEYVSPELQNNDNPQSVVEYYDASVKLTQPYDTSGQLDEQSTEVDQPIQRHIESDQPVQYDESSHPVSYDQYDQLQFNESGHFQQYDENGQPIQTDQYVEQSQFLQYDQNGHLIQQYDENGQVIQQYDEHGNFIPQYDESGQLLQQYSERQPQYDEHGQLIPQYDDHGQVMQQFEQYDENGQLMQQFDQQYDESVQPLQQFDQQYNASEQALQEYDYSVQQFNENLGQFQVYDEGSQNFQQYPSSNELVEPECATNITEIGSDETNKIVELPVLEQKGIEIGSDETNKIVELPVLEQKGIEEEKNENLAAPEPSQEHKKSYNVMEMLDTDTESAKQDTKVSNDSDFDFSNG